MEEKLILCPNCRGALTICDDAHDLVVSCPRCGCVFFSSEAKEVSEDKKEEALKHAMEAGRREVPTS